MRTTTLRLRHLSLTCDHGKSMIEAAGGDVDKANKARRAFVKELCAAHGVTKASLATSDCGCQYLDLRPDEPEAHYTHEITMAGCALYGVGVNYVDEDGNHIQSDKDGGFLN